MRQTNSLFLCRLPPSECNEREYVLECIDSGWIAVGPFIERFEEAVSSRLGVQGAVAVSTGTAALQVSLRVLGVGPGDAVLCPTLTFVATTNAIDASGARPVFLDSQKETWGIDPGAVEGFLREECRHDADGSIIDRESGLRVKAIMVVHVFGHPVDMDPVLKVADEYGLPVIEDAAESLGSLYKDGPTGAMGRMGCLSFNGNKTITSGGGGMIVSGDAALLQRARYLINQARDPGEEYYHSEVGYNFRLSNLHAAVGLAQFECLDQLKAARRSHAVSYAEAFHEVPGIAFFEEQPWAKSNYWLSTVLLDPEKFPLPPVDVVTRMHQRGIEVRRPFVPNHLLPPYREDRTFGSLDGACLLYQRGLNLPSSAWMTNEQIQHVARTLVTLID